MRETKRKVEKVIAWILLIIMGIHCFGDTVPSSVSIVHATDYEKASEEAEKEIRAAEQAAGIIPADEEEETAEEKKNISSQQEDVSEEEMTGMLDDGEEPVLYEDKTISSDTTLTEDMEVGNLTVNGKLHLNGHRLIVHGDITLNAGLYIEEGYMSILGSFKEEYRAFISMTSANDYIEVVEDYIYYNYYSDDRTLSSGMVLIGGNIYGAYGDYCSGNVVFGKNCKVIMNGNHAQTINIRSDSKLRICNLVIENTSSEGVLSNHILNCESITDEQSKLHYKAEGSFGETLTEDKVIEGNYCLLGGTLDLSGYSMTIKGNLLHAGGKILLNGGSLTVEGDYQKQFCYMEEEKNVTEHSLGRLIMKNEQDYMLIKGDYIDSGLAGTEGDMTAGTMELKGSIVADDNLSHALFYAKENHQVKLTGDGKQIIRNGSSYSGDYIRFANLYINQPESGSVALESTVAVTKTVEHVSQHITGTTKLEGAEIAGTEIYGNIRVEDSYSFLSDAIIHGNLYMGRNYCNKNMSIKNCHIIVEGNLYHADMIPVFTGEQAMLTVMGDYIVAGYGHNIVESGIVQIAGDLKKSEDASISFGSNAELQFIGKTVQRVSVSHANTILTNVVVDNPEGVIAEDNIAVVNVSCIQGVLSYASGGVHGFTVEEDGEYEGDLVIGGGSFYLNGHKYHVKGNLTIANGTLNMTDVADYLIVDGDFTTKSTFNHTGKLTAGTLEVKGDFTQKGNVYAFTASENHNVIFSGNRQQKIDIAYPENSPFCNLNIVNAEGVVLNGAKAVGKVKQTGAVEGSLRITSTTTFDGGYYDGNIIITEQVYLPEKCKIEGQLSLYNNLHLNGNDLEVTDKVVTYSSGGLYLEHGTFTCKSYEMQSSQGINMQYEDDKLLIENDFIICSTQTWFNRGYISVGGDISFTSNGANIGENVVLEMNGDKKQTITMTGNKNSFGTLVLNNTSEEGVYVASELNYKKLVNEYGGKVSFADGGVLGYTLDKDEVIEGDFLLSGGEMDLNGHNLTIKGDFLQSGGNLRMNKGNLLVEGDYCLAKRTKKDDNTYQYTKVTCRLYMNNPEECITVYGDMYTAVSDINLWSCSEGKIKLEGNLSVEAQTYLNFQKNAILELNGDKQQRFSGLSGHIRAGSLVINNDKGLAFNDSSDVNVCGTLDTNGYQVEGLVNIDSTAIIMNNVIRGNLCFINNYNLDKDLYVEGNIDLCRLNLNGYHLTVAGDCTMNSGSKDNYTNQKDGILEVKGDLIYNSGSHYQGSGTNQVILSGDKKQTIQVYYYSWSFRELIIQNTSDEGVYANGLFDVEKVTDPDHKLTFGMEGITGYTLTQDTVIQGDLTLLAGTMDLNGHKLTITGNLLQRGGTMDINSGRLEVCGNYRLGDVDASGKHRYNHARIYMDQEADHMFCGGGFYVVNGCFS